MLKLQFSLTSKYFSLSYHSVGDYPCFRPTGFLHVRASQYAENDDLRSLSHALESVFVSDFI